MKLKTDTNSTQFNTHTPLPPTPAHTHTFIPFRWALLSLDLDRAPRSERETIFGRSSLGLPLEVAVLMVNPFISNASTTLLEFTTSQQQQQQKFKNFIASPFRCATVIKISFPCFLVMFLFSLLDHHPTGFTTPSVTGRRKRSLRLCAVL